MAMLEVKDLHVYYGVIQALKGISFEVNQGEVIALIGANGAGKTTTLQTLTGLLSAKEEIETTNQKLFEITGVYPAWLRPPYGEWRKNLDFYVEMFPVLWDVDTLDWKSKNVDSIMKIVRSEVSDGAVILMHDAYQSSVDAALQIVDLLMAEEYEFVTVEELILP